MFFIENFYASLLQGKKFSYPTLFYWYFPTIHHAYMWIYKERLYDFAISYIIHIVIFFALYTLNSKLFSTTIIHWIIALSLNKSDNVKFVIYTMPQWAKIQIKYNLRKAHGFHFVIICPIKLVNGFTKKLLMQSKWL